MRLYPQTYSGGGIYWLTIPLCVGKEAACGIYLVDTGGFSVITTQDAGTPPAALLPRTHTYGSGSATGWPTVAPIRFTYTTELPHVAVTHKVAELPFAPGIDGVLGLLPAAGSVASALDCIHIDFRAHELYFNQPHAHGGSGRPRIVHTPRLHPPPPSAPHRLWLRGSLALLGRGGATVNAFDDVWMVLDTGATVAMTFVTHAKSMATVEQCDKALDIHTMRITGGDDMSCIDVPMPQETLWPSCVPTQKAKSVVYIVLGIQMLSKLQYLHYTIAADHAAIGSLTIGL